MNSKALQMALGIIQLPTGKSLLTNKINFAIAAKIEYGKVEDWRTTEKQVEILDKLIKRLTFQESIPVTDIKYWHSEKLVAHEWQLEEWEEVSALYYEDIRRENEPHAIAVYDHPYCGGSDYSGDSVTRANYEAFLEEFDGHPAMRKAYGGHGTYGVFFRLDLIDEQLIDAFRALDNYPVLDEDKLYAVESAAQDEAWEGWVQSDFRKGLIEHFQLSDNTDAENEEIEQLIEDISSQDLRVYLHKLMEKANEYWEIETGNSAYIRLENLYKHASLYSLQYDDSNQMSLPLEGKS
jgi:hypothetical protein